MNERSSENSASESAQWAERLALAQVNLAGVSLPARQYWPAGLLKDVRRIVKKTKAHESGCIEWVGPKDWDGYGIAYLQGKSWRANRLFYFLFVGEIPKGHCVMHSCDNPSCVNPSHLTPGTNRDNVHDALTKGRMLGPRGEMNGQHKLRASEVQEIKRRYRRYDRNGNNMYDLASEFGVSATEIHAIIHGNKWQSIMRHARMPRTRPQMPPDAPTPHRTSNLPQNASEGL